MKETTEKINDTKSWFFEKIKLINLQPESLRKKREGPQINKIRNEKAEVTMDTIEIQRIIKEYYKQLCANKKYNLEEMDKFLENHNHQKNQEETENMNKPIKNIEI